MEKNNGKIAIAIVAMFVVALSIVGVTYAYFVAAVQGNTDTNVEVVAGMLEVAYTNGDKTIDADNIVPGWISDGKHYFDATKYTTTGDEVRYTAQVLGENEEANGQLGISTPKEFTVAGTDNNTGEANYVIILNGITVSGIGTVGAEGTTSDASNFKYALCKGDCPTTSELLTAAKYDSLIAGANNIVSSGNISLDGSKVQIISNVESVTETEEDEYQLMVYYIDANDKQTSTGASFSARVDIIGVQQSGANWVDADGTIIPGVTKAS